VVDVSYDAPSRRVDGLHQPPQPIRQPVVVDAQLGGEFPPVATDIQWLGGDKSHTALGPADVESSVPLGHLALLGSIP